jgi:rfaE bifunctional protein nucleotidyltransferase chain/domain
MDCKIGLCNGCFDVLHAGHRHFLRTAKSHCDYLIVALNSDESVRRLKGDLRPVQRWYERMSEIMETGLVDAVIPYDGTDYWLLLAITPAIWFRGEEHRNNAYHSMNTCAWVWIPRLPELGSTTENLKRAADSSSDAPGGDRE